MSYRKLAFPTAAAACALAIGLGTAPAFAFEEVDWEWNLKLTENITKDIDIDANFDPTGMVLLEDLQIQIGDVEAESNVWGVWNNQPGGGGTADFTVTLTGVNYNESDGTVVIPNPGSAELGGGLSGTGEIISGTVDESGGTANGNIVGTEEDPLVIQFTGVTIPPAATLTASTDLPEVNSVATAVGNNVNIESDVMVEVHEGQFVFDVKDYHHGGGGGGGSYGDDIGVASGSVNGGGHHEVGNGVNEFLVGAVLGVAGAVLHAIDPADISAKSSVGYILNASVNSEATAVANNKSITLLAAAPTVGEGGDNEPIEVGFNFDAIYDPENDGAFTGDLTDDGDNDIGDIAGNVSEGTPNTVSGTGSVFIDPDDLNLGTGRIASDHVLIGDITQFSYANVTARSSVYHVALYNYGGLGLGDDNLGRSIVNSVATAVGNNLSIKVGVPDVDSDGGAGGGG